MVIGATVATRASSAIRYSELRPSPNVNRSRRARSFTTQQAISSLVSHARHCRWVVMRAHTSSIATIRLEPASGRKISACARSVGPSAAAEGVEEIAAPQVQAILDRQLQQHETDQQAGKQPSAPPDGPRQNPLALRPGTPDGVPRPPARSPSRGFGPIGPPSTMPRGCRARTRTETDEAERPAEPALP